MGIVVHHLEASRSHRVLFLLEELGVPYEIRRYARHPKTGLAPPELRQVHPLGKAPVITDGDVTVAESGAIIEYLLEAYDPDRRLTPPLADRRACVQHRYWLHYTEGSAIQPLVLLLVFSNLERNSPAAVRAAAKAVADAARRNYVLPNVKTHLDFVEKSLGDAPWCCGAQFTGADVQLSFFVESAETAGQLRPEAYPKLTAYLTRIRARPAYQRARARGGPPLGKM